ncbi:hypothetical protein HPB51_009054 [Rhipicephalus microplus]|uniref:SCP domain-containing protein n=1 Tax=Rhipicephalus microplus TaxID=6941 RepID=A0A9J6D990_RHIMP|nr:hypothetical protein HPB51_009054 [Rhipicephalus microplus]
MPSAGRKVVSFLFTTALQDAGLKMVWYSSHKVGCGFHYCDRNVVKKPFYNYVCNYCPIGNYPERFGKPYTKGKPCSKCPGHCRSKKLCS